MTKPIDRIDSTINHGGESMHFDWNESGCWDGSHCYDVEWMRRKLTEVFWELERNRVAIGDVKKWSNRAEKDETLHDLKFERSRLKSIRDSLWDDLYWCERP